MRAGALQCTALSAACFLLIGCVRKDVFLIDQGYEGPVVVMFACPGGDQVNVASSTVEYQIGPDGLLLVEQEFPPARWVKDDFFWVDKSGARRRLPQEVEASGVQVFGFQIGAQSSSFEFDGAAWIETKHGGFFSFLVGRRGQVSEMAEQLEMLQERAVEQCSRTRRHDRPLPSE